MIRLTCTQCQEVLSIDDAFAGGVCRCQHCGTIQTVPKHLKESQTATVQAPKAPKTLYQNQSRSDSRAGQPGTGLDDLANVVASSGMASPALRRKAPAGPGGAKQGAAVKPNATAAAPPAAPRRKNAALIAIAGAAVAAIIVIVLWVVGHNAAVSPETDGGTIGTLPETPHPPPAAHASRGIQGPSFAGIPLKVPSVIYVIDRGGSSKEILPSLMAAVYRSIASLGSERQYQIIFWSNPDNGESELLYPPTALGDAGSAAAEAAKRAVGDIVAFGQSSPVSAMKKAMAQHPAVIVLVTAKSWDLDEQFQKEVLETHNNSATKIDTLAIGPEDNDIMKAIAQQTGGTYQKLTSQELAELGS